MALATELTQAELEAMFEELAARWHDETGGHSVMARIVNHPVYLQIIGLGPRAIPLILEDLRQNGGWWFTALRALTRQDPCNACSATDHAEQRTAWLLWGETNGFKPQS